MREKQIMGPLLVAAAALLGGCGGSESGEAEAHHAAALAGSPLSSGAPQGQDPEKGPGFEDPPDRDPPPGGGASTGGGDPPDEALSFEFTIDGVASPIPAHVVGEWEGAITIDAYPQEITGTVQRGPLTAAYPREIDAAFCRRMRALATTAARNGTGALRERVRNRGGVTLELVFAPFLDNGFSRAAAEAAEEAGSTATSFYLTNLPDLTGAEVEIELRPGAMSHLLGGAEEIAALLSASLQASGSSALRAGYYQSVIPAADFLCDLQSEQAEIRNIMEGEGYAGEARLTGLD